MGKAAIVYEYASQEPGKLYDTLIAGHKLEADVYHAHPAPRDGGKAPTKRMMDARRPELAEQLEGYELVIMVGAVAFETVRGVKGFMKARGRPIEEDDRIFLATLSPGYLSRYPDKRGLVDSDLRLASEILVSGGIPREENVNVTLVTGEDHFQELLADLRGSVAFDIETTGLNPWAEDAEILVLGFGTRKKQYVIPVGGKFNVWHNEDAVDDMVERLTVALEDVEIVAHNGKFDLLWLRVHYGVEWKLGFDTMLAAHLFNENGPIGLKDLATIWFNAPDWEIDLDEKTGATSMSKMAFYNGCDVFYTRRLRLLYAKKLRRDPQLWAYFQCITMPTSNLFVEIEYNGVFIDEARLGEAERYLSDKVCQALDTLESYIPAGEEVNWNSPQQVGTFFFDTLGLDPVKKTDSGNNSTDSSVLKRLDHPAAAALLEYRAQGKLLNDFVVKWKGMIHKGRLHPSYKIAGPVTGRLASEDPNIQQTPRDKRIRSLVTAPKGWTFCQADLSQIELRVAAEMANEPRMKEAYRLGQDLHLRTAIQMLSLGGDYTLIMSTAKQLLAEHYKVSWAKPVIDVFKAVGHCGKALDLMERARDGGAIEGSKKIVNAVEAYRVHVQNELSDIEDLTVNDACYVVSMSGPGLAQKCDPEWYDTRSRAKAVNFGFLYGMGHKLFVDYARDTYGVIVTLEESKKFRERFFEMYPGLVDWHQHQRNCGRRHGYVRSLSGRKRNLPACQGGDGPELWDAQRQAINSPVQEFGNCLNLMALIQLYGEFSRNEVRFVGAIHDAILLWIREGEEERIVARVIEVMSKPKLMSTLDIHMSVPLEAEADLGPWGS